MLTKLISLQVLLSFNGVDYSRISNSTYCGVAPLQWPLASSASFPYGRPGDVNSIDRTYCAVFRFVPMWDLTYVEPPSGPEYGGTAVQLTGGEFLPDAPNPTCIFRDPSTDLREIGPSTAILPGDLRVSSPFNGTCTTRMLHLPRPEVLIYDKDLQACLLQRPYNPDCNRTAIVECNGQMLNSSTPARDFVPGYRRSVCLPPNLACQWDPFDPTTSQLACKKDIVSLETAYERPDPDIPVLEARDLLVSMNGEHWVSAPAVALECHLAGVTQLYAGYEVCGDENVNRSLFHYYERPNVTNIHPDVVPYNVSTLVTVIGEGFQNDSRLALMLIPRAADLKAAKVIWGSGALAENVTYVDTFTATAMVPSCGWAETALKDARQMIAVDVHIALNGLDFSPEPVAFYYTRLWSVTSVIPWQGKITGGSLVTAFGPFFRFTRELTCQFGDFPATAASFLSTTSVVCRTPSVVGHGRMSVEVSSTGCWI